MNDSDFMHWYYEEASPADKRLHDRLYEFDELFEDMRFEPRTLSYGLIKCQNKPTGSGEWEDDEAPRPEELEYFSYETIKTRVTELFDCEGYYSASEKLLCLDVKVGDDDATLR